MSKTMQGKEIEPRSIGKVRRGNFFIPGCPDYSPTIDLPTKVKLDEILIGWHCRNCRNFTA